MGQRFQGLNKPVSSSFTFPVISIFSPFLFGSLPPFFYCSFRLGFNLVWKKHTFTAIHSSSFDEIALCVQRHSKGFSDSLSPSLHFRSVSQTPSKHVHPIFALFSPITVLLRIPSLLFLTPHFFFPPSPFLSPLRSFESILSTRQCRFQRDGSISERRSTERWKGNR